MSKKSREIWGGKDRADWTCAAIGCSILLPSQWRSSKNCANSNCAGVGCSILLPPQWHASLHREATRSDNLSFRRNKYCLKTQVWRRKTAWWPSLRFCGVSSGLEFWNEILIRATSLGKLPLRRSQRLPGRTLRGADWQTRNQKHLGRIGARR